MRHIVIIKSGNTTEFHGTAEVRLDAYCDNRGWLARKLYIPTEGLHRVTVVLPYEVAVGETRKVTIFDREDENSNRQIIKQGTLTVVVRLDGCSVLVGERV
jgi:hypothetical protein